MLGVGGGAAEAGTLITCGEARDRIPEGKVVDRSNEFSGGLGRAFVPSAPREALQQSRIPDAGRQFGGALRVSGQAALAPVMEDGPGPKRNKQQRKNPDDRADVAAGGGLPSLVGVAGGPPKPD